MATHVPQDDRLVADRGQGVPVRAEGDRNEIERMNVERSRVPRSEQAYYQRRLSLRSLLQIHRCLVKPQCRPRITVEDGPGLSNEETGCREALAVHRRALRHDSDDRRDEGEDEES